MRTLVISLIITVAGCKKGNVNLKQIVHPTLCVQYPDTIYLDDSSVVLIHNYGECGSIVYQDSVNTYYHSIQINNYENY